MFRKKKDQKKVAEKEKVDHSGELKKELSELHKFKWSNILWPIISIFFIFGILFYVFKAYIIDNTNPIVDRKTPDEKIKNKPDAQPEEIKVTEPKAVAPKPATTEVQYDNYTVQDGDTLGAIATEHGFTIEEVLKVNPGLVAENLQIGQIIKIPKQ